MITDLRVVAWRRSTRFSAWHLEAMDGRTQCGIAVESREVQTMTSLPLHRATGHVCAMCTTSALRALENAS